MCARENKYKLLHTCATAQQTCVDQSFANLKRVNNLKINVFFVKNQSKSNMFVTVYLVEAKTHTVVPQEFIYELNQENLCNHGVNTNQNRLIFFSTEIFEALKSGNNTVNMDMPKFDVAITNEYPLPNELKETCFVGRLKKFWGKTMKMGNSNRL